MSTSTIALVTDFGITDPYVGIMKGVITSISPGIPLIDLTHQIPPGDIQRGSFVLWQSAKDFPQETIFLAVVDPGVGTDRKGLCIKCQDQFFIGPDNGLFSYVIEGKQYQAWELTNYDFQLPAPDSTFHGRDIFAPAAAHLTRGITGDQFGIPLNKISTLPSPKLEISASKIMGEILSVDRFGNLFSSLGLFYSEEDGLRMKSWLNSEEIFIPERTKAQIMINEHKLNLVQTFGDISVGSCAGVIGSTGLIEIISSQSSAAELLMLKRGDEVHLEW